MFQRYERVSNSVSDSSSNSISMATSRMLTLLIVHFTPWMSELNVSSCIFQTNSAPTELFEAQYDNSNRFFVTFMCF